MTDEDEFDDEEERDEFSPLTLQDGPLPQAASWPLGTPHTIAENMAAMRSAYERQKRERRGETDDDLGDDSPDTGAQDPL